ncbi:hypothetical protein B0H12DRAFT_1153541 [Mycena haematopus]|nr:hypothetical protein B0H12DRAFT_1153541 [Mycena haematopus]
MESYSPPPKSSSQHNLVDHLFDGDDVPCDFGYGYSTVLTPPPSGTYQLYTRCSWTSPHRYGPRMPSVPRGAARPLFRIQAQPHVPRVMVESACLASGDALPNGVDAVSAAFLQLVELQGRSQLDKSADKSVSLLILLLSNGFLAPDKLLAVVDWERLRNLAEESVSRVFRPAPRRTLNLDELPTSLTSIATPSDLNGIDQSDYSANFLPLADTRPYSSEAHFAQPSPALTLQRGTSPHLAEWPIEPGSPLPPAEHQQFVSQTPHTGAIVHTTGVTKRRCRDCGVDRTKQWRTHPDIPGYSLCNACGQHQAKHRTSRSLQTIRRGNTKANQ